MSFLDKIMTLIKGKQPDENKVDYVQGGAQEKPMPEKDVVVPTKPEISTEKPAVIKTEENNMVEEQPVPETPQATPVISGETLAPEEKEEETQNEELPAVEPESEKVSQDPAEKLTEKPATSVEELEKKMEGPVPDIKAQEGGPAESDKTQAL